MNSIDFTSRIQSYVNFSTVKEAAASPRFDITQIKYDGWWARLVITGGIAQIYSRQGQLKETRPVPGIADMVLIGEFLKGTNRACAGDSGKVMVFDALYLPHPHHDRMEQVFDYNYAARERLVRNLKSEGSLPDWAVPVESYHPNKSATLWDEHVMNGGGEGLVYRSSRDSYHPATIGRVKRVVTMDYVVMGFTEGAGKRKGMAGNLTCGLYVNGVLTPKVSVGGGFNNAEMIDQFQNFDKYKGRVLEVMGWQLFESGALRHPNACRNEDGSIRWRDDKRPEDCVWSV